MTALPGTPLLHKVLRVLLVDDDAGIRNLLRLHFAKQNWVVYQAGDGRDALERLRDQDVDLVLTDLKMPRMDGLALIAAIRAAGKAPLVVVMTGNPPAEVLHLDGIDTASAVLFKPFDFATLRDVLADLRLTGRRAAPSL